MWPLSEEDQEAALRLSRYATLNGSTLTPEDVCRASLTSACYAEYVADHAADLRYGARLSVEEYEPAARPKVRDGRYRN